MRTMDEAASTTDDLGSVDPDPPGAEPLVDSSPATAAAGGGGGVEVVSAPNRAGTRDRLKQSQREEKHAKLKTSRRQSKPSGASAYAWKCFQTYVQLIPSAMPSASCSGSSKTNIQNVRVLPNAVTNLRLVRQQ